MKLSPHAAAGTASRWAAPILFSAAVHLSFLAGYALLENTDTPPRPPPVLAIEVVLTGEIPGIRETHPSDAIGSAAQAPAAPAAGRVRRAETPQPEAVATEQKEKTGTGQSEAKTVTEAAAPMSSSPEEPVPRQTAKAPEAPPVSAPRQSPDTSIQKPPQQSRSPRIQPAAYAPLPKRKPVLTPQPAGKTAIPAPPDKAAAVPARSQSGEQTAELPDGRSPAIPPDTEPSAASAGEATATLVPPRYATPGRGNPLPAYPRSARRRGIEGRLVLRVRVDATGRADSVRILESSGHGLLDRAAERAVKKWTFEPARRAGVPVDATLDVPVVFRLRD